MVKELNHEFMLMQTEFMNRCLEFISEESHEKFIHWWISNQAEQFREIYIWIEESQSNTL